MTEQERRQKIERAERLLEEYIFAVNQRYAESNFRYSIGEEVVYYGHKGTIVSINTSVEKPTMSEFSIMTKHR